MVEHKLIVDGLRLKYEGLFEVVEFFKEVEDWMREKGMEKEIKKKEEHVKASGKKIQWFIEIWKKPTDYAKQVVRVNALMDNVKEISIVKGGHRKKLNQGDILVIFDAFLETDLEGRWQQKPVYWFLRALYDKFIWKIWTNKFEDELVSLTYDLHKRIHGFLNLYKY